MMRRFALLLTFTFILLGAAASAEDPKAAAAEALSRFISAWNQGNNDAVRATLNYPHLTLFGAGQMSVAENPGEFSTDFEGMREEEGWARSDLRLLGFPRVSADQVHVEAAYTRYDAEDAPYRSGYVYYIVTKQDGHWGMQFRMPFTPDDVFEDAAFAARKTIEEFFEAWNAGDNEAIHKVISFPHAFVLPGGPVAVSEGPEDLMTDFTGMRERAGWHHSEYEGLDITYADSDKAIAHLTFTRHHENGSVYRTVPVVWFITRHDDGWGVQVRAIFPNVEGGTP